MPAFVGPKYALRGTVGATASRHPACGLIGVWVTVPLMIESRRPWYTMVTEGADAMLLTTGLPRHAAQREVTAHVTLYVVAVVGNRSSRYLPLEPGFDCLSAVGSGHMAPVSGRSLAGRRGAAPRHTK